MEDWKADKRSLGHSPVYVTNREELLSYRPASSEHDYLFGMFSENHLPFQDERDPTTVPSLAEMTKAAIERLR